MSLKRSKKIAGILKAEIGDILQTRIQDPLIGFVTIMDVVLSQDLRMAKIYFSVLGDENQKKNSLKGLERARSFIQNELGTRIRLRYLPVLRFYLDESWVYGSNIDRILHQLQSDNSSHMS